MMAEIYGEENTEVASLFELDPYTQNNDHVLENTLETELEPQNIDNAFNVNDDSAAGEFFNESKDGIENRYSEVPAQENEYGNDYNFQPDRGEIIAAIADDEDFDASLQSQMNTIGKKHFKNEPIATYDNKQVLTEACSYGGAETQQAGKTINSVNNTSVKVSESKPQKQNAEPLPNCRNKRSYVCGFCNMKTINPREYLYHLRDTHGDNIKVFECSLCIYASKTHQKLVRHNHMVHKITLTPEGSDQKKKPKEKVTKPPVTKKVQLFPINRSPRESKSPRRFEEYEFTDDVELDCDERPSLKHIPSKPATGKQLQRCNHCKFSTFSAKVLSKHESKFHLKRKFYKCTRCDYATHVKARYTKHMKYHQLPIIKCDWCDFRTPYRWNLDRHTKNHTEEVGEHKCHLCNFTAQIKQSLTVHIANHHLTPEQIKEREAKRTIGVCDPEDCIEDEEMELLRMERDEDPDALEVPDASSSPSFTVSNIDVGNQEDFEASYNKNEEDMNADEPKRKKPKIKITLKKTKTPKDTYFQELNERHNFDEDFIHPDDVVHRHGNVYIKTEKCNLCSFKAPFQHEIQRHKKKVHGIYALNSGDNMKKGKKSKSQSPRETLKLEGSESSSDSTSDFVKRKYSISSNSNDSIPNLNFKDENTSEIEGDIDNTECLKDEGLKSEDSLNKESGTAKKKTSFFDKLQEKLSSSNVQNLVCQFCGHESKCLSESVRHQKLHLSAKNIFATPSLSTRCQFCRHRCKTTDDLMNHLKLCPEARKNQISDDMSNDVTDEFMDDSSKTQSDDEQSNIEMENKHPMENKVFVWNNISNFGEKGKNDEENSNDCDSQTPSENAYSVHESDEMEDCQSKGEETSKTVRKKVYRCPECKYWSTTASRFHIHIVGHYNTKPYMCSECEYRSNWRWDVTKHIKLKSVRDKSHKEAEILIVDEGEEKSYDKYDTYLTEVKVHESYANCTEGGISSQKSTKHRPRENDSTETDSTKSSPCPTPLTFPSVPTSTTSPSTGSETNKIPAPPKLMRAPNRQFASSPGPNPFGPINIGAQMMVEVGNNNANNPAAAEVAKKKFSMKPPPLVAMGAMAQQQQQTSSTQSMKEDDSSNKCSSPEINVAGEAANSASSNYQIITPQGALHTSLETLQLLAEGSTNLAKLKKQQKETGEGKNPELDAAIANQMRLLIWLNCLAREAQKKESEAGPSSEPPAANIMKLVLDHEGNPEWKCLTCDFRDNEQETVVQHVRLAHSKKGPVSLVHAVHRCSVCGFAAGTKRHVQLHLETAHNGQGGIISRSEGQNIDPESGNDDSSRSFDCRLCPFTCKKRGELKNHLSHHTPRVDYIFKCMFCSYYVATKGDLFNHLSVHGMDIPASAKESANNSASSGPIPTMVNSSSNDDGSARHFVCDLCPFETRSRAKLMHHRQFHRPRGLPFSCPHCSYNVTRRHLLAQHLRIHGVSPTEGLEATESQPSKSSLSKLYRDDSNFSRSKSPSPSLTITPITSGKGAEGGTSAPKIDSACLPTLSDELTKNLHDIPLVWVSRDGKFFKMFKCRHCPHVNLRKTNIQEHEKMHRPDGLPPGTGHACQYCSYISINAGVMSTHLKVHNGSLGKCHAIVDQALPNEEQLHMLAGSAMKKAVAERMIKQGDEKLLYYCQNCPGRFFFEKEVQIHSRFHISNSNYTHSCSKCSFGARDESQILAHVKVHTPEYQERTRTLMAMHPSAPSFPPVQGMSVPHDANKPSYGVQNSDNESAGTNKSGSVNGFSRPWLSSPSSASGNSSGSKSLPQPPPTSRFKCDQCPSTFSKLITLQYHQSLHSADNPFRCNRCTYAAKTQDGLQQHSALHDQADLEKNSTDSFLSPSPSPAPSPSPLSASKRSLEETLGSLTGAKMKKGLMGAIQEQLEHPPIKLKFIGLKGASSSGSSKKQFKYYIEEQVPLSGVELLKRKNQIEREMPKDAIKVKNGDASNSANKLARSKQEARSGNPKLYYPLHIDKSSGKSREKRYKCSHCPSAFEKLDQLNVHLNLHGSNYKYKCRLCDYSVKFDANFKMHIKRHKYHEKMDAQKKGLPLPSDDQLKYEPIVGENMPAASFDSKEREEMMGDKENQFDFEGYPDMTTVEKQQIILQHKKADAFKPKDEDKDKKAFYCQYCPYASMRRDAVDSHSLRHKANMGRGLYKCNFCDYTASQPNFIREHTKVHFRPFKYVQPEGFMRHDKMEIWGITSGEALDDDAPKKSLIFGHDDNGFTPSFKMDVVVKTEACSTETSVDATEDIESLVDSQAESGILVDYRSGDVIEAPTDFIIPLRPTKGKVTDVAAGGGSSSGKHKSSKGWKARKKAKLESCAVVLTDIVDQNIGSKDVKLDLESVDKMDTNDCQSNALSTQEDGVLNSPSTPYSSTMNGELANENGMDEDVTTNSNDDYQDLDSAIAVNENVLPISAATH